MKRNLHFIIGFSFLFFCLIIHISLFQTKVSFSLQNNIEIEYGDKYEPIFPEYKITNCFFKDILKESNRIEFEPLNFYNPLKIHRIIELKEASDNRFVYSYYLQFLGLDFHLGDQLVRLVDTTEPVIQLIGEEIVFLDSISDYKEYGVIALDNKDGVISENIKIQKEQNQVIYTITDTAGNIATKTRYIKYNDIEPPKINLNGLTDVYISVGTEYIEAGYSAYDNKDGDITNSIKVKGFYDTNIIGDYTLVYSVSDISGNIINVNRNIHVIEFEKINPNKTVFLTFDDGPSKYTLELLDILDTYNVKATFFVTGSGKSSILKEIVNRGHAIGAHTYTHDYSIYTSEETYYNDLNKILQLIKTETGVDTKLIRFPGGSSNGVSKSYCKGIMTQLTKSVKEKGFYYFDWNVSSTDGGNNFTTESVYENVIKGISSRNYSIVLQHDTKKTSIDAVGKIIEWGINNGYVFDKLHEYSPGCHQRLNN